MSITRRAFTRASLLSLAGLAGLPALPGLAAELRLRNRLFIMDTWFWRTDYDFAKRVAVLRELGVGNMLVTNDASPLNAEMLGVLDEQRMSLEAVYFTLFIEDEPSEAVMNVMKLLEGRGSVITLALNSRERDPSDWAGDAEVAGQVEKYLELAEELDLTLAFYPHAGFWLERVSDAARLARQFSSPRVGAYFNLYHYLARDAADASLDQTLDEVIPYLKVVTINGARRDTAEVPAHEAILPLDEGDYDLRPLLRQLVRRGYAGPIGLQGYGIEGEIPAKLGRSVARYQEFREAL